MFFGEFRHSVDAKGRLFVPAKLREGLGESFIVTRGLDSCLFVYPRWEWEVIEQKLKEAPATTRADLRAFMRRFFSGACEVELDKQGRILLSQNLREHAQLERDAVIIGVANRVEIWAENIWNKYSQEADVSFEQLAEKLVDFGL